MLIVPIELRSSRGERRLLYTIEIENDLRQGPEVGSYQVRLRDGRGDCLASSHILHLREQGALALVAAAMRALAEAAPRFFS